MAAWLTEILSHLLPHHCVDEFFVKFNYYHVQCLKITLSKFLGIGIILGSILVKVPQIVKLFRARSGEGISIYGLFFELLAIVATMAYSLAYQFPFSAWGEGFFLLIQTTIVAFLVLYYEFTVFPLVIFLSSYTIVLGYLLSGLAPLALLSTMQASNVPIIVIAKTIQALQNYKNGSTGQLSAITVFLLFGGSLARIFTSVQETGDSLVIVTHSSSALANGIIAAQMLYYWRRLKPLKKE